MYCADLVCPDTAQQCHRPVSSTVTTTGDDLLPCVYNGLTLLLGWSSPWEDVPQTSLLDVLERSNQDESNLIRSGGGGQGEPTHRRHGVSVRCCCRSMFGCTLVRFHTRSSRSLLIGTRTWLLHLIFIRFNPAQHGIDHKFRVQKKV